MGVVAVSGAQGELADALGVSVTFMAKYSAQHAGSSCHIHVSLWQNEQNAFARPNSSSEMLLVSASGLQIA